MLSEPSLTLLKETPQQILVPEDQTDSLQIGWFPNFPPASLIKIKLTHVKSQSATCKWFKNIKTLSLLTGRCQVLIYYDLFRFNSQPCKQSKNGDQNGIFTGKCQTFTSVPFPEFDMRLQGFL